MASKTVKIVQGSDIAVTVSLTDLSTNEPFNLTGFTGATGYFPAASGGGLPVIGTLISADCGKLGFDMDEAQTGALLAGEDQDIEVEIAKGSDTILSQIIGKLTVLERLF
jgi:hypothetical protein